MLVPEYGDFNDDLVALGPQTLAARIAPFIAAAETPATVEEAARGRGRSSLS